MPWIRVYRGNGPTDAFLVRDWLGRCGIPSQVHGDLTSIRGEIPIHESWPSVWVETHREAEAKQAIGQMTGPRLVRDPWICPACGADGEPDFDVCWNCDGPRPA